MRRLFDRVNRFLRLSLIWVSRRHTNRPIVTRCRGPNDATVINSARAAGVSRSPARLIGCGNTIRQFRDGDGGHHHVTHKTTGNATGDLLRLVLHPVNTHVCIEHVAPSDLFPHLARGALVRQIRPERRPRNGAPDGMRSLIPRPDVVAAFIVARPVETVGAQRGQQGRPAPASAN